MPRRNRPQHPHRTPSPPGGETVKKSYRTHHEAEEAAARSMRLDPELKLFVYLSPHNGKWYLTRNPNT